MTHQLLQLRVVNLSAMNRQIICQTTHMHAQAITVKAECPRAWLHVGEIRLWVAGARWRPGHGVLEACSKDCTCSSATACSGHAAVRQPACSALRGDPQPVSLNLWHHAAGQTHVSQSGSTYVHACDKRSLSAMLHCNCKKMLLFIIPVSTHLTFFPG